MLGMGRAALSFVALFAIRVWRVPVAVFLTKKSLFGLCSPHFEHGFMIRKNRL